MAIYAPKPCNLTWYTTCDLSQKPKRAVKWNKWKHTVNNKAVCKYKVKSRGLIYFS